MLNGLVSAGVLHDGTNLSYHSPLYAEFDIGAVNLNMDHIPRSSHVSWTKADSLARNAFKDIFEEKLRDVSFEIDCTDINCTSVAHKNHLEEFTLSVLSEMEAAAKQTLPNVLYGGNKCKNSSISGWNEYVKPFAEESRFWFNIWVSAGKPRSGELFAVMKSKKSQYKYAIRRLKRCTDIINNNILIESLVNNDKCIFAEIKKLKKNTWM